jgi:hypothetical protein
VKPTVFELLSRDGVIGRIGEDRIHGNVFRAVEAQISMQEASRSPGS